MPAGICFLHSEQNDKLEFGGQCPLTIRYEPCLQSHIASRPLMLDKLEFECPISAHRVGATLAVASTRTFPNPNVKFQL